MFSNLIGNEEVKHSLQRLLENGRLPGSLLFTGEEGVGKKLFALELAKIVNCKTRRGFEACDECSSCKRISHSTFPPFNADDEDKTRLIWSEHADVAMVRPYKQIIRVGPIRELEREANFRPFEGAGRLFIIEDADYMNDQAANALLKTLEEPEPTTHLVLTTTNPSALPATIRSRCQTIQFAPISAGEIEKFLIEAKDTSPKDAQLLARTSRGSLGRACAAEIDTYRERREAMIAVLEALTVARDRAALMRSAEELAAIKDRDEYEQSLGVLQVLIRDAWALSLGRPKESLVNLDVVDQLQRIAGDLRSSEAAAWLQQIEELRGALEVNINRKIASDALLFSMTEPDRVQGPYSRWRP
ncbi:MAG TPA: DNA polymerase III subunit delta' [Pyrinomonadaceae bacterium]|nr:DNA polymerase III subunit delta' [Pyrinomonadaceae bacterium]